MFARPVSEHFATFEAQSNPLEDVRVFVRNALMEASLDKKAIAGLMLAVEEAVTNIIRHGYLFGPGRIRVRVRRTRHWLSIILSDGGRPYSLDTSAAPDAAKLASTGRRGGLGVYLMRKVTDRLDYERVGDENILTLSKRLHRDSWEPVTKSSLRRRVAWTGVLAVTAFVVAGGWFIQRQSQERMTTEFYERWEQFGRTAAAAASQHILNDRSDAEFDQLVVGLKKSHPDLDYLIILSPPDTRDTPATGLRVRAHSESPERVHDPYVPPDGIPAGEDGRWLISTGSEDVLYFAQTVRIDNRNLGAVVWAVAENRLTGQLAASRRRIFQWAGVTMIGGWLLVIAGSVWMARPMLRLVETLRSARLRGVEPPTEKAEPDEIRQVVEAFRDATASVAQSERQMAERDLARREIEASRQLQSALLPARLPEPEGYEFGAVCRMARQVGGDYYDFIDLGGGRWLIIVADVAGKGFPAALIMTALRTATRLLAPRNSSAVSLLAALHEYLTEHHPSGPFVTACTAVLDAENHTIDIASAGHTPAILCRTSESGARRINPRGRPLGVPGNSGDSFAEQLGHETLQLLPGDRLLLFTDGLVEIRNATGEAYGYQRLEESVLRSKPMTAPELAEDLVRQSDRFAEGSSGADDLTLLLLTRPAASGSVAKPTATDDDGKDWLAAASL